MEIVILTVLFMINGVFALTEIAFVSARREEIEQYGLQGNAHAASVLKMMDEPERFLSSIQIGITLIGIISGAFGGIAIAEDVSGVLDKVPLLETYAYQISLVLTIGIITYFSIVIGELVPKTIALKNPERTILFFIPFIKTFANITHPIVSLLSASTRFLLRLVGIRTGGMDQDSDPIKEILGIAKMAAIKNKIDKEQEKILINTMNIKKLRLGDIMVKREEIKALTTKMSLSEALIESHIHHHTRYPLVDHEAPNKIYGYVNFKDIVNALRISPTLPSLRGICRPITFLSEKERVIDGLRFLIRTHQHIAVIKGPSDIFSGMVTLEDILEEIVGDIQDEHDFLPEFLYNITDTRMLAGGGLSVSKLRQRFSEHLPDSNKTLSQWLIEQSNAPLRVGNKLIYEDVTFLIRKISKSKVYEVIVEKGAGA